MDNHLIDLYKFNISQAISDYFLHSPDSVIFDDFSEDFINRLAVDSFNSKTELRNLFSTSPVWNPHLQALVINGSRTHNPDFAFIDSLARDILLEPVKYSIDCDTYQKINRAIDFFSKPDDNPAPYIDAINSLAPNAYAPNKKKSRIFKAICNSLGVSDDSSGSTFQKLFAKFADELSAKKIDFKLFVSINPAHFLTMSNPKDDLRGSTLTSCHSLNCTDYPYNCGCSGYARDSVTFIAFTVDNPDCPESFNNRKTSRQLFMYKPFNGLLLQSRLYNTSGGTSGEQADSNLYRDLIQREISDLEHAPNLWKTFNYNSNSKFKISAGTGFGGYHDWLFEHFNPKISIRYDHEHDFKTFTVGSHGLCIKCGDTTSNGLYCCDCSPIPHFCDDCENESDDLTQVHDFHGNLIYVCDDCLDEYYRLCQHCGEYFHIDSMHDVGDFSYVCRNCLQEHYTLCVDCDEYFHNDDIYSAVDRDGNEINICFNCVKHYIQCYECGRYVMPQNSSDAYNANGEIVHICPDCREHYYQKCDVCGNLFHIDHLTDRLCAECYSKNRAVSA